MTFTTELGSEQQNRLAFDNTYHTFPLGLQNQNRREAEKGVPGLQNTCPCATDGGHEEKERRNNRRAKVFQLLMETQASLQRAAT